MSIRLMWRSIFAFLLMLGLNSALAQSAAPASPTDEVLVTPDRFEKFNRDMYQFNDAWDQTLFKPVSKVYQKTVPTGIRGCVHGILDNLSVPYTALNNVLQGKFKAAGQDMCRFVVNSTAGLGGCFDVASKIKLPKHDEDFGQTLGVWGVPAGAIYYAAGFRPSTVRDAFAKPIDFFVDPVSYIKVIKLRNSLKGLRFVDTRTSLSETLDMADDIALDKYALIRDVWLQSRQAQVKDENEEPDLVPLASQPLEQKAIEAEPKTDVSVPVPPALAQ